jgi:hypothetical protein
VKQAGSGDPRNRVWHVRLEHPSIDEAIQAESARCNFTVLPVAFNGDMLAYEEGVENKVDPANKQILRVADNEDHSRSRRERKVLFDDGSVLRM